MKKGTGPTNSELPKESVASKQTAAAVVAAAATNLYSFASFPRRRCFSPFDHEVTNWKTPS